MPEAKVNLIIGKFSEPTHDKIMAIGFQHNIKKVVLNKRQSEAYIQLENHEHIYRISLLSLKKDGWNEGCLDELLVMRKDESITEQ